MKILILGWNHAGADNKKENDFILSNGAGELLRGQGIWM